MQTKVNDFLVNHSIPHRFVKATSVGVHWCGHCGKMVSISKASHYKCSDCNLIAHDGCHSKIPNLCGLPEGFLESMRAVATQKLASKHNDTLSIATTSIAPVLTAPYTFDAPRTPDRLGNQECKVALALKRVSVTNANAAAPSSFHPIACSLWIRWQ